MAPDLQQALFPELAAPLPIPAKPANVSSVPQRSPFRYPGGKTWFIPTFRNWMKFHPRARILIEPFAGGGAISLTAAFEKLVDHVVMAEIDPDVSAVWKAVVTGEAQWLAEKIMLFDLTRENVIAELAKPSSSQRDQAFKTILKNRTFHGGILADGSGLLKHGENGKGIQSRWYPATLSRRFRDLDTVIEQISFHEEDAFSVMQRYRDTPDAVFFIDPPYTAGGKKAGKRLYRHSEINHTELFSLCAALKGDFIITYDHAEEVMALARRFGFQMRLIPMKNTHHATMEELVIGRDLTWMDGYPAVHEPRTPYLASPGLKTLEKAEPKLSVES